MYSKSRKEYFYTKQMQNKIVLNKIHRKYKEFHNIYREIRKIILI